MPKDICPHCGSTDVEYDGDARLCNNCCEQWAQYD